MIEMLGLLAKSIFREITEISATKCHILKLKCSTFDFGWGSAPDPAGELTALPQTP